MKIVFHREGDCKLWEEVEKTDGKSTRTEDKWFRGKVVETKGQVLVVGGQLLKVSEGINVENC